MAAGDNILACGGTRAARASCVVRARATRSRVCGPIRHPGSLQPLHLRQRVNGLTRTTLNPVLADNNHHIPPPYAIQCHTDSVYIFVTYIYT